MAHRCDFTEEEQLAMDDHIFYHRCMIEYFEKRKNGEACSLPPKPKRTVTFLEGRGSKKSEQTVDELHEFLKSHLVEQEENDITEGDVDRFSKCLNVDEMVPFLRSGFGLLKFDGGKTIHSWTLPRKDSWSITVNISDTVQTWTSFY